MTRTKSAYLIFIALLLSPMMANADLVTWEFNGEIDDVDGSPGAYTHVAHEGGFDLGDYSRIGQWLGRVEQQKGFVPMRARA